MDNINLLGLKGGKKQHWLRLNAGMVYDFYIQFGRKKTMKVFRLKDHTLDKLVSAMEKQKEQRLVTADDLNKLRAYVDYALAGTQETKGMVNELRREYGRFTEAVAESITRQFLEPLIRHTIQVPDSLAIKEDPLSITNFDFKLIKVKPR